MTFIHTVIISLSIRCEFVERKKYGRWPEIKKKLKGLSKLTKTVRCVGLWNILIAWVRKQCKGTKWKES